MAIPALVVKSLDFGRCFSQGVLWIFHPIKPVPTSSEMHNYMGQGEGQSPSNTSLSPEQLQSSNLTPKITSGNRSLSSSCYSRRVNPDFIFFFP